MTTQPSFIHLRVHSAYSLLEGAIKVKDLIKTCKAQRMPAVALTDTGNLFGAMEFSLTASDEGIQPILGCQIALSLEDKLYDVVFLVQSAVGYKNLIKLVTRSYARLHEATSERPSLKIEDLAPYTEGLLLLTGGLQGPLSQYLRQGKLDEATHLLTTFQQLFGDRLYIELNRYEGMEDEATEEALLDLAFDHHIPIVATNEAFFLKEALYDAHDALMCIAEGKYVDDHDRRQLTAHHRLKTAEEMVALFQDLPEAIANTVVIAKRCHFVLKPIKPMLPSFPVLSGLSEEEALRQLAREGLEQRLDVHVFTPDMMEAERALRRKAYDERMAYELDVIIQMGFSGYFLIVADFIQWAKNHDIPVGPGRGSGAGSVVAWSLTITDLDPLRFALVFERFLNPERVSMPDFDIDFCQDRRDEVINYVREKYGEDRVAQIITFGKLQARAVLRDVGRVLKMPYGQVDRICKLIPNNPTNPVTLEQALELDPQLQSMVAQDSDVGRLMGLALQLEGLYRHASTHAAGVVISDQPLDETVPLYYDVRSTLPATQFNMKYVEQAGLIKFDFLGLKTLTVLQKAVDLVKQHQGLTIDLSAIPLDDPKTFALLQRVEAVGIFQVESAGMRDVMRKLQPEKFEELIALIALYRPGPMDDIPRFLACRHGKENISYAYPCLKPILDETYGVMVYQEQVLQIARDLAGYTLGAADILRRAMGKKIKEEMDAQRKIFVDSVVERQGGESFIASDLFDQIAKFAGYAFNKAHAAAYALILYQTAYMKANYPAQFMAASMTLDSHNTDKLTVFAREAMRMGICLLPPDINHSEVAFSLEKTEQGDFAIRYALAALKNVGAAAIATMVEERRTHGAFSSVQDFFKRTRQAGLNKRQLESLIAAGAFDSLHDNRRQLFEHIDRLIASAQEAPTAGLFEVESTLVLPVMRDWSALEKLRYEFASVGFYLSGHPLDTYQDFLQEQQVKPYADLLEKALEQGRYEGRDVPLAGIVIAKQERSSKSGQKYAFVTLSDTTGFYEVALFSEQLAQYRELLTPGRLLLLQVAPRIDGETLRLTCYTITDLNQPLMKKPSTLTMVLTHQDHVGILSDILKDTKPGNTTLTLQVPTDEGCVIIQLNKPRELTPEQRSDLTSFTIKR